MDDDARMARITAAVVEHFDIGMSDTADEMDEALRAHNHLIRRIGAARPDLYDRLKELARRRRASLGKDNSHG